MPISLTAAALLCSGVLVWSGIAKLRDPESLAVAMRELRVPSPLSGPPAQHLVPFAEIALGAGVLLLPARWSTVPWAFVLALFVAYLVLIARAAAEPEPVSCNCFGSSNTTVTGWTVARNALLVALAAAGLMGALLSPERPPLDLPTLAAVGLVLLAIAAGFALGRDQAPPVAAPTTDQPAPQPRPRADAEDADPDEYVREPIPASVVEREPGQPQLLSELVDGRAVVLVYLSASCAACEVVAQRIPGWAEQLPGLEFVVLAHNRKGVDALPASLHPLAVADVARSTEAGLGMHLVPSAAILGADGFLAGGPVAGVPEITAMVDDVIAQFAEAEA